MAEDQWGLITRRQVQGTGLAWTTLARLASGGALERIAHGIYRVRGAPRVEHVDLRAAWLQLAPDTFAWERKPDQGVVSHRSAAALYELGHLPADVHEFTLPVRRQSRRPDVRLHRSTLDEAEWTTFRGLPVTRPRADRQRHGKAEFLAFMKQVAKAYPRRELHVVLDNYHTHKHADVEAWLAKNPRITLHFTPTSGSWLNLVEVFFGIITRQAIRRGSFSDVKELTAAISRFIDGWNDRGHPFTWTKTADEILTHARRQTTSDADH